MVQLSVQSRRRVYTRIKHTTRAYDGITIVVIFLPRIFTPGGSFGGLFVFHDSNNSNNNNNITKTKYNRYGYCRPSCSKQTTKQRPNVDNWKTRKRRTRRQSEDQSNAFVIRLKRTRSLIDSNSIVTFRECEGVENIYYLPVSSPATAEYVMNFTILRGSYNTNSNAECCGEQIDTTISEKIVLRKPFETAV